MTYYTIWPSDKKSDIDNYLICLLYAQASSDRAKGIKSLCNHNAYLYSQTSKWDGYCDKSEWIQAAISYAPMLVSVGIDDIADKYRYVIYFRTPYGQMSFHSEYDYNIKKNGYWQPTNTSRGIAHRIINRFDERR